MNESTKKTPWEFFIDHRRFTIVIILSLLLMGALSTMQLPRESEPEVDIPVGVVSVPFPGASAEDVEELITNIIEDKVLNIDDIKKVTSTSKENVSVVVVEFEATADSDEGMDDLKEKVDEIKSQLPDEALDPIVKKVRFADEAIYTFAMSGPHTLAELKAFAEPLQDELERIAGVSSVTLSGAPDTEMQVLVNKALLDRYGLSINQVTSAISSANTDIPTGTIETDGAYYNVRLEGRIFNAGDISLIPIALKGRTPILVRDVATVIDGNVNVSSISRLSIDGGDSLPALTFNIFKQGEGNIIEIVDTVISQVDEYSKNLPDNVNFEVVLSKAKFIKDDLSSLINNGLGTVVIVMLLLLIFLGWREALIAGFALPMSFLITFIFLQAFGYTINFITLFALILALGILIDSAIVVIENLHRGITRGLSGSESARDTIRNFHLPLTAGTLTTVFAFVPMLMMSGIVGQFIKGIPVTITFVLLSSLLVALGFITTLGEKWLSSCKSNTDSAHNRKNFFNTLRAHYSLILDSLLRSKKKKVRLFIALIIAFIFSMSLPMTGALQVAMFPDGDQPFMFVDLEMPAGTPIENTANIILQIENQLTQEPGIQSLATTIGSASPTDASGGESGERYGYIFINLKENVSSLALIEKYQSIFNRTVNAQVSVGQYGEGPPSGAPVEILISGTDLSDLEKIARSYKEVLSAIEGTRDVQTSINDANSEFVLSIDREKALRYGLNTTQLAATLRNAVTGSEATVIRNNGEETDVVVKYALGSDIEHQDRTTIGQIESLTIATQEGDIPLSEFTTTKLKGARPVISHQGGERIIRVTSYVTQDTTPQEVFTKLEQNDNHIIVPTGYIVKMGGETEDIDQSFNDMFRAMFLAIFLIAALLVLQFNSYRQPLFILATIPLALIGVFPGLTLVGQPLSFPGIIGVLALVGIVVNNAIILIDRINKNRLAGEGTHESVVHASTSRLEPILLTTITTVLGLLPITINNILWAPLGLSIIFGLTFSTFLTLVVVPTLYLKFAETSIE